MNWIIALGIIGIISSAIGSARKRASERRISEQQAAIVRAHRQINASAPSPQEVVRNMPGRCHYEFEGGNVCCLPADHANDHKPLARYGG